MPRNITMKVRCEKSIKRRIRGMMHFINMISMVLIISVLFLVLGLMLSIIGDKISEDYARSFAMIFSKPMQRHQDLEMQNYIKVLDDNKLSIDFEKPVTEHSRPLFKTDNYTTSIVQYRVWREESLIFDSKTYEDKKILYEFEKFSFLINSISQKYTEFIYDDENNIIGRVEVRLNPSIVIIFYSIIIFLAVIILIFNLIIVKILTYFLSLIVTNPLKTLNEEMEKISSGSLENEFQRELVIKKPVEEVKALMNTTNKIVLKVNDYAMLMMAQNQELEAQKDELEAQRDELEAQKDELEAQNIILEEREDGLNAMNIAYVNHTRKLMNLLNNVGQGFLTVDKELKIKPEYSNVCELMIKPEGMTTLNGKKITETLMVENDEKEFITELYSKIFESDPAKRALYITLLPEEMEINSRYLRIEYKIIKDNIQGEAIMIILTDITNTRNLEHRMQDEQEVLRMIVKVLVNRDEFLSLMNDYKEFTRMDFCALAEGNYEEILREIHTFKGSFSQYYLNNITNHLNDLEDRLYKANNNKLICDIGIESLGAALEKDIAVIESYVGEGFFKTDEVFTIKSEKFEKVENKIKKLLPLSQHKKIIPIIHSLRYKSVKKLLITYPDYVLELSQRLEKQINDLVIEGDDVYVDHIIYQKVFKTFVHIFRNSIDHGIEVEDTRLVLDKPQKGTIKCQIKDLGNYFEITISDDGQGMNRELLKEKALEKGIMNEEEIEKLSDKEALELIFFEGFSTKENATIISGRGVGLSAVYSEVEALGGSILINSKINEGTTFTITLPYTNDTRQPELSCQKMMKNMLTYTKDYLQNINVDMPDYKLIEIDRITLNRVSCLIGIEGDLEGVIIMSVSEALCKKLVSGFMIEPVPEDEFIYYMEDVLGEVANQILGNVLGSFEDEGFFINIGVPAVISSKQAFIKHSQLKIISAISEKDDLEFNVNLLVAEDNRNTEDYISWVN